MRARTAGPPTHERAVSLTRLFGWISHTWDHPNIDEGCATQNYIEAELNREHQLGRHRPTQAGNPSTGGLGLT